MLVPSEQLSALDLSLSQHNRKWPTTIQTSPAPSVVVMQVTPLLRLGRVQRHRLPHASAASADGEVELQRESRIS